MKTLAQQILDMDGVPYVYTYPPTRMYQSNAGFDLADPEFTAQVNLYVHFPFCRQKCSFCGYLTVTNAAEDTQDIYVDCVIREIELYRRRLEGHCVQSVNFGGGTPSLLTTVQFQLLLDVLISVCPDLLDTSREISVEATPESIASGKIQRWLELGLNRVSVGIQSFDEHEIKQAKRNNFPQVSMKTLEILRQIGVPNISCDLMYGLEGQTPQSWETSVKCLIEFRPETIELYSTTAIPGTVFARRQAHLMTSAEKRQAFAFAQKSLLDVGYVQDAHLRFVIPPLGAYHQQANVFAGQSLIGFGVGARSYAQNMHYRNVYSASDGRRATQDYMETLLGGRFAVRDVATLSADEQMRRYVIYRLEHLCLDEFSRLFGIALETVFSEEIAELFCQGLIHLDDRVFRLTTCGLEYRDLIAHRFFSKEVRLKEAAHWNPKPAQPQRHLYLVK